MDGVVSNNCMLSLINTPLQHASQHGVCERERCDEVELHHGVQRRRWCCLGHAVLTHPGVVHEDVDAAKCSLGAACCSEQVGLWGSEVKGDEGDVIWGDVLSARSAHCLLGREACNVGAASCAVP